jgi:hypothetical protein
MFGDRHSVNRVAAPPLPRIGKLTDLLRGVRAGAGYCW